MMFEGRKRRKEGFWIFRFALSILLVAGLCVLLMQGDTLAAGAKKGGIFRVGVTAGPSGWDPHSTNIINSWNHQEQVYETLVRYNHKMEIEPSLATSWEQLDPLTLIFHLRKGVKFHNGREMVADDVKYSFDRLRDPKIAPRANWYETLKSIEVLDNYTVRFRLSMPDPRILPRIAFNICGAIVPREVVKEHGDLKTVTCGTGPFKVKKYVAGDYTVYERNPDYWEKGFPRVDGLHFQVIKDETSRLAALRKGTVDIAWLKDAQMGSRAQEVKGLRVIVPPPARQQRFFLNCSVFPFNNKKLRQAVAAATNRDAQIKTAIMGFGEITSSIPPAAVPYALSKEEIAKLPFYKRDVELSKRLSKEAGYPDGFEFTMTTSDHSPDYLPSAQMWQSSLKEAGIKMKIEQVEWGIHLNRWHSGDFQAMLIATIWAPDPDTYIMDAKLPVYSHYTNPELEKLLQESLATVDEKNRIEIWRKIQYIMADENPIIFPYVGPTRFEVIRDYVKDYKFLANTSRIYLKQAWLEK